MLKLIPILIITIIFYFTAMAQVIIKEEVDLSIEDIGDTTYSLPSMPFYGRVKVERVCSLQWWYTIAAVKVTVGNQSQSTACYNCGTSGCAPCIAGSYEFVFNNQPQGTGVSIEEQICPNGIPASIPLMFIQQTSNQYSYKGYHQGHWWSLGAVTFTTQIPPECEGAEYCQINIIPPAISINEPQENINFIDNPPCIDIQGKKRLAYSAPATKNIVYFNISDYCFDLQEQKWKFILDNEDNAFKLNWVIDFCLDHFPQGTTLLDDLDDIPANYPCLELKKDLELVKTPHAGVPTYMFKSVIKKHELAHRYIFEDLFNANYHKFFDLWIKKIKYGCENLPPINQVKENFYNKFEEYVTYIMLKWLEEEKFNEEIPDIEKWIDDNFLFPHVDALIADIDINPQNYNCQN